MAEGAEARGLLRRGLLWIGLAGLAVLHLVGTRRDAYFAGDEAWYLALARSLMAGGGYAVDGLPHAVYPPGFPFALIPAVARWGIDPHALVLYSAVISLVGVCAVGLWFRFRPDIRSPSRWLWFVLASVGVFEVFTDLRSEGLFILVLALLLAYLEAGAHRDRHGELRLTRALGGAAAGFALGMALPAVRSVGMALPVALVASQVTVIIRRGDRPAPEWTVRLWGAVAGSMTYLLWWLPRGERFGEERSYGNLLTMVDPHQPDLGRAGPLEIVERLIDQAAIQMAHGVELLSNLLPIHPFFFGWPQLVLLMLVGVGVAREFGRRNPVAGWFFLGYVAIIVSWPFDERTRFLVPVFPFLLLFAVRGAEWGWARRPRTAAGWRRIAGWAALFAAFASVETLARGPASRQGWAWVAAWIATAGVAWVGAERLTQWRPRWSMRRLRAGWAVAFLLAGLPALVSGIVFQRAGETKFQADRIGGGVLWIRAETDSTTVLAATAEHQGFHLHTGRTVRGVPTTADPDRLWAAVDESAARYLVVPNDHEYPYLRPTGAERLEVLDGARPGVLHLVFAWPMGRVFEIRAP